MNQLRAGAVDKFRVQALQVHHACPSSSVSRNIAAFVGVTKTTRKTEVRVIERMLAVSRVVKAIRSRREINRTRRELNRAIANATTPAMRDELILVAQRGFNVL